ncbi:MAG: hypothetical protein HZB38_11750 [Planctomycetes bacterium]|nr:hypothetical protein [Planctomycetota bacterium]
MKSDDSRQTDELDRLLRDEQPLVDALAEALRPAALPEALRRRIESDWHVRRGTGRLGVVRGGLAAAAAIVMCVVWSGDRDFGTTVSNADVAQLSPDEMHDVIYELAALRWNPPLDSEIEQISQTLETVNTSVFSENVFGLDDDWDAPRKDSDGSSGVRRESTSAQTIS